MLKNNDVTDLCDKLREKIIDISKKIEVEDSRRKARCLLEEKKKLYKYSEYFYEIGEIDEDLEKEINENIKTC